MKITDIIKKSIAPEIYTPGTSTMWTDKHIAKQLLNVHLDQETDLASRRISTIKKTAGWILDTCKTKGQMKILDLGCGPGLYSEIFAQNGHEVTGIDYSETSIAYAKRSAEKKGLNISYETANYLEIEPEKEKYDLAILIYTDLGVLHPSERKQLLDIIYNSLKKGGILIFDVLKDNNLSDKILPKNWEAVETGFWRPEPYIALSASYLYEEQKVILYQHIVAEPAKKVEVYRFWTHYFSAYDLQKILSSYSYTTIEFRDDILPKGDNWSGNNVLFCTACK